MENKNAAAIFADEEFAASYDNKFPAMEPFREAQRLLVRASLCVLPEEARLLCVGAGTGLEVLALAEAFPKWRFTIVEPSQPMLAACQRRAHAKGFAQRCEFHGGYLDSLADPGPFDGATCLLVSQFVLGRSERVAFFGQIASRLRPGGLMVSADLSSDMASDEHARLFAVWKILLQWCGIEDEAAEKMLGTWKTDVSIKPAPEVEAIIQEAGFETSTQLLQTVFIRTWLSRRAS